jgi:hypothetical protein
MPDFTTMNFETAATRGIPPGEYRINVDCYRCPQLPIDVQLQVSMNNGSGKLDEIATSTIHMTADKQEKTGIAFTILDDGRVDPASLNTVFKPLRSGEK